MLTNINGREILEQKEIKESSNIDYSIVRQADLSESEINWIKLHQMFDK